MTAPLIKPEPVIVKFTVVFAGAVFGVMLRIAGCGGGVRVMVGSGAVAVGRMGTVGTGTVGEGGAAVMVGSGVAVITVTAGVIGVKVREAVGVATVGEGMGEAV